MKKKSTRNLDSDLQQLIVIYHHHLEVYTTSSSDNILSTYTETRKSRFKLLSSIFTLICRYLMLYIYIFHSGKPLLGLEYYDVESSFLSFPSVELYFAYRVSFYKVWYFHKNFFFKIGISGKSFTYCHQPYTFRKKKQQYDIFTHPPPYIYLGF